MMRISRYSIMYVIAMTLAIAISACSATQLKTQWRDPDYRAVSGQRVLVIAVFGREERRRTLEDRFAARLRQEGVDATASYGHLPNINGPKNLDAVKSAVERSGATMVLSVQLVDVQQRTAVGGGDYDRSGFYSHYPRAWAGVGPQPYVYTYRTYSTETRVFDIKNDKMIWAATMESEEPGDSTAAASEYANLVVEQLRSKKIIGGG
ncbi:MAG TPA: hypothetical protein VJS66_07315 [Burkholderiales bacterium]|nr:hypothetical protein [Burkholderiales bacterium]